ncbi:MAG TPA: hypothetical protein PLE12_01375 [Propionicimonas sp.]|nr:hypothetical protein [Propionicimonas sp.]
MSLLAEDGRVTLALGELADLFSDPVPDPLAGRFRTTSGIEDLVSRLDARSAGPLHLEIGVERGAAGPDEAARAKRALEGCCAERIETLEVRRHQVERLGRKELAFGLVFLAACLAAASGLAAGTLGPDWLRDFFAEGLVIVGWIALWHPVDMLLFERLPILRDQRVLRRIQSADVRVQRYAPSAPGRRSP